MTLKLTEQEAAEIVSSLKRYFREELECEISDLRAGLLLRYISEEIAPFAYNKGVSDAETHFQRSLEDLTGACYESGLTYWTKKRK